MERDEKDFEAATREQLERAESSEDDARLKVLDELYETLEAELVEDAPTRP